MHSSFMIHLVVSAEAENIEAVGAPRDNCRSAAEHSAERLLIRRRRMPGAVPGLMEHLVVGAERGRVITKGFPVPFPEIRRRDTAGSRSRPKGIGSLTRNRRE